MDTITDEFLTNLIECQKKVLSSPGSLKENRGHLKADFKLVSVDEKYTFIGYIRKNKVFHENFSIGLDFNPKWEKGSFCLLRFNGKHGRTLINPHHIEPHIHKASAALINSSLKAEGEIEHTKKYLTLEEAIIYWLQYIHLLEDHRHFLSLDMRGLFE